MIRCDKNIEEQQDLPGCELDQQVKGANPEVFDCAAARAPD